jgi:indole-3-glycerol phosphate synthase
VSMTEASTSILERILIKTRDGVARRREAVPYTSLEKLALETPILADFVTSLRVPGTSVIAEFKRASPSKGRFPVDLIPFEVASEYIAGGAAAMSVLTDEPFFQGQITDLSDAARVGHAGRVPMQILPKDFIIDEYQILEARAAGADAILLIVAALDQSDLGRLARFADETGIATLVEVHDLGELERAGAIGAKVIGVNNRDLSNFKVDLATTEALAPFRPADAVFVSESGIFTRDDVVRLEAVGVDAVLVGESIMLAPDRAAAIRALRGE